MIALLQRPPLGRRIAHWAAHMLLRLAGVTSAASGLDWLPHRPTCCWSITQVIWTLLCSRRYCPPAPGYTFTAKREFAGQRLMRALLTGLGAIFIERFDVKRSMEDVDLMVAALIHGDHLLVFPEGTFSRKQRAETFSCRRFRGIGLGRRTSRGGGFARQAHCVAERNRVAAPRRDRIQS